jgi:amino acid adenylation domain-containing protein
VSAAADGRDGARVFATSFAQQRLWFLAALQPDSAAYNVPRAVRLTGPLDAGVLQRALDEVAARHAALRTTFAPHDGVPMQIVAAAGAVPLERADLSALAAPEREAALARALEAAAAAPFDLEAGPLVRAHLVRLGAEDHVFLLNASHTVIDGLSLAIVFKELSTLYAAFAAGRASPLAGVAVQLADQALAERERLQGAELERLLTYWRERLGGELPRTELPPDRPRPASPSGRGRKLRVPLADREGAAALAALARQEGTTAFATLLAAFAFVLRRYTGQDDVVVGSPFGNRTRAGEGGAGPRFSGRLLSVGFYAATVVLRLDTGGEPTLTFRELVRRARATVDGAAAHVDMPFEKLVEALRPARENGANPFFQIMLSHMPTPDTALALPGVNVTPVDVHHGASMFDLLVQLEDSPDGVVGHFTYSADLYDEATMARFAASFAAALAAAVEAPDAPASALPVPAEAERRRVLLEWNDTAVDAPPDRVHAEIARQVARTPARVAVRTGDHALTYEELDRRSERLARRLEALGVGPDALVGVSLPRGPDLVVAVLAVLKAGGAYVPLDPTYPAHRLALMLEDARAAVVVTTSSLAATLPLGAASALCIDAEADAPHDGPVAPREARARPEHLAYVIYTSGSTGAPKGVMVEHRQVTNFFAGMDRLLGAPPADGARPRVWLAMTSLSFDISVLELLWTLARGYTVVVADDEDKAGAFAATVARHGVTHFQCTPSLAGLLVADEASRAGLRALDAMLVGGEALSPALARELAAAVRGDLYNMYGPTETTIWSTAWRVDRAAFAGPAPPPVSLGAPLANTTVYLLDERRAPVPLGVAGELYVGGAGVTRGYLGQRELTDERFVPNPFGPGRLYRTGDLGRRRADGALEFLGRADHQVKIRGHRVELAEIELTIRTVSGARDVVVVARPAAPGRPGSEGLVAYLAGASPTAADLRRLLRERLPAPLVPTAYVVLERLPLTPNGKVDRQALPAPESARAAEPRAAKVVPPSTPTEAVIAEIWREALGLPAVSIYENFYDLGGHSLLSTRVVHQIEQRLGKRLNVSELILQNLAQLAARCDQLPAAAAPRPRGVLGALRRMIGRG